MLNDLRNNVYVFSGAKQYHQVREMTDAIYDKDRIKPFSEYKKTGADIFKNYNENYLRAEYNAAISQSRSASMWMEIESNSELLPMLTYSTVGDGRVRIEHAMLNNISRPVNDKFWDNYFPPNGWNCRCTTLQTDDSVKTSLKGFKKPDTVPPEFMMNAGKQKIVFSDKHPYFVVADRDRDLASNNFYMPKPKMEMPKISTPVKIREINSIENHEDLQSFAVEKYNLKKFDLSKLDFNIAKEQMIQFDKLFNEYKINHLVEISTSYDKKLAEDAHVVRVGSDKSSILQFDINKFSINKNGTKRYESNQTEYDKYLITKHKNYFVNAGSRNNISTVTHEFSHLFGSIRQAEEHNFEDIKKLGKEINKIKTQYTKELNKLDFDLHKGNISESSYNLKRAEIYISEYAKKNKDEFMAESFTMFKLSDNVSKYAKMVGDLIDANFKK
jgi:SPP1 gp7 family putative phage head morphogenesis protein